MKIGITCYPTVGGSGIIATELGMKLAEIGYEVHFITSKMPFRLNKLNPKIFYHEVEITNYPVFQSPPYDLALAAKMAEIVEREKLDILHVHYAIPHAISAILARDLAKHDVKVVTTLHGTDITVLGHDSAFKRIIQYGIEQSDAVTAVSNSLVQQTKEMIGVEKDISVIYNFVNEDVYYRKDLSSLKKQLSIEPHEKIVMHISNFRKVKRIPDVIQTFKNIRKQVKAKLLLVGDGPEASTAYSLVKSLNLENDVLFLGKQREISDLLSIADLMLLLSEHESFGLVLLEGMSCKVPAIGTNVGGIPEVIKHNETGFIVDLGAVEQAANYAIKLLLDDNLLKKFSNQALTYARQAFHSSKIVKQYTDLYEKMINKTVKVE